ncbi:AbiV family abortive infection protein [Caulobacter sp. DWR1-3-2b1]|uniref:AbiV family abortive infection protein n=1 Tax=Caulobacter sp. DWR1-3-2b1 TaxID=2804670 RepID=UPI003CFB1EA1
MSAYDYAGAVEAKMLSTDIDQAEWDAAQPLIDSLIVDAENIFGQPLPAVIGVANTLMRLLDDAEFLSSAGRFDSALSISVLAFEEVGKLIVSALKTLGVKSRLRVSFHDDKQVAVACMIVARHISERVSHLPRDATGDDRAKGVDLALEEMLSSGVLADVGEIVRGDLNLKKKAGFYFDFEASPDDTGKATQADVTHVMHQAKYAFVGLLDRNAIRACSVIYGSFEGMRSR